MWQAQRLVQHAVQPDTGDIVPAGFKIRSYQFFKYIIFDLLLKPRIAPIPHGRICDLQPSYHYRDI